jgi:hypothetical protein
MPAKSIHNQAKLDFIAGVLRKKIQVLRLHDTPACQVLAKQIGLSHATLLKALKNETTGRTVLRMINAGWFTLGELNNLSGPRTSTPSGNTTPNAQTQNNDQAQQKAREDAAFKRGYQQGKTEGYTQGQRAGGSNFNRTVEYNRGYADGLRAGQTRQPTNTTNTGLPMDRLERLFNMTIAHGAAQGEVTAARNAAGKALARWIKDKFGQDVTVQVT